MDLLQQQLKSDGWYLTQDGLKKLIAEISTEDVSKIRSLCLNRDLKDIGGGALPSKPESNGTISGHIVLQIQKIRNISAPKANEECSVAPRLLQIELTDGENTMQALELESIPSLNLNLAPGTKIMLKADRLRTMQGFIILKAGDVQVLGGYVIGLSDKWELTRQTQKYTRNGIKPNAGSGFPPLWVPFGKSLESHSEDLVTNRNFKSLEAAQEKEKVAKDNAEFDTMRSEAIALALKQGGKKTFGGGQQNIVDHNLKKILDKGYSESEAKHALKITNNNLERALYNLKRKDTRSNHDDGKGKNNWNARNSIVDNGVPPNKPAGNVSLYDFLTNKLPMNTNTSSTANTNTHTNTIVNTAPASSTSSITTMQTNSVPKIQTTGGKFENNMSASFAANRAGSQQQVPKTTENGNKHLFKSNQEKRTIQNTKSKGDYKKTNSNENTSKWKNDKPSRKQYDTAQSQHTYASRSTSKRIDSKQQQQLEPNQQNHQSMYQNNKKPGISNNNNNNNINHNNNNKKRLDCNGINSHCTQTFMNDITNMQNSSVAKEHPKTYSEPAQHRYSGPEYRQHHTQQAQQRQSATSTHASSTTTTSTIKSIAQTLPQHTNSNSNKQNCSTESKPATVCNNKNFTNSSQPSHPLYDVSKIVGFQNKAANEYAINLLKSQGLTLDGSPKVVQPATAITPAQHIQPQQQQQQQQQQQKSQVSTATSARLPSTVETPTPLSSNVNTNNKHTAVQQLRAVPNNFNSVYKMNSSDNCQWKMGDYCLAKYWEDGKYYEAEIRNITSRTYVVLFTGYGNFEEVLKSDCLPITDDGLSNSINTSYRRNNNATNTHKYRIEREMYVPPPKRGN